MHALEDEIAQYDEDYQRHEKVLAKLGRHLIHFREMEGVAQSETETDAGTKDEGGGTG